MRKQLIAAFCALVLLVPRLQGEPPKSKIKPGASIYVEPMGGFEYFVMAALSRHGFPVKIVLQKPQADFVIEGSLETSRASSAKVFWLGTDIEHVNASLKMLPVGETTPLWKEDSSASFAGLQHMAERFARELGKQMEGKQADFTVAKTDPKIFVAAESSLQSALLQALKDKHVHAVIVDQKDDADYVLQGVAVTSKADTRRKVMMLNWQSREQAAIALSDQEGYVVYAYDYYSEASTHGVRSSAGSCAKHLSEWLEKDAKRP